MDTLFLLAVAVLSVFALLSLAWGVDSRDGSADPRRPDYPVSISV